MTKHLSVMILVSIFVFPLFTQAREGTSNHPPIRVMIDPGHGGQDDGAVKNGVREKDITLRVALALRKLLEHDPQFVALITRDRDIYIPLDDRSQMARDQKADVFISIHANSSTSSSAKGTEIYFENQIPTAEDDMLLANRENATLQTEGNQKRSEDDDLKNIMNDLAHNEHMVLSQKLAQLLLESFQKKFNIKTRAIRQAPFRVLEVNIPSTLIELGFITNSSEAQWLSDRQAQARMAKAIYKALKSFKIKLDKIHREG